MRLAKALVPVAVVAAVAAVAGGVSWAVRPGPLRPAAAPSGPPPVLRLVGTVPGDEPLDQLPWRRAGGYRLAGPLPNGPPTMPAYRVTGGPADVAEVQRLAAALGLSGGPRRTDKGWVLDAGGNRLAVSDGAGQGWSFGPASCVAPPSYAVADCPVGAPVPARPPAADPGSRLRRVLAAVGGDWGPVQVSGTTANADPVVAGRPVSGFGSWLRAGPDGTVQQAAGSLGRAVPLATYPVISARVALDRLRFRPRIMAESCLLAPDGRGCLPTPVLVVTGAAPGLRYEPERSTGAVLAPAWLFDVRGQQQPVAQLAVADRYLG